MHRPDNMVKCVFKRQGQTHLPEVPSAKEMEENGIRLGKMKYASVKNSGGPDTTIF